MKSKLDMTPDEIAAKPSAMMHEQDKCAHTLGMKVESVSPGTAAVSMTVHGDFANGHGYCQGGIIATLADTAFAHACNSYNEMKVAQGFSIEFVRSAKVGEQLLATASEQSNGKTIGVYQVLVTNSEEKLLAIFNGRSVSRKQTFFKLPD